MRRIIVSVLVALTAVVTWSAAAPSPAFAAGETWTAGNTPQSSWRSVAYDGTRYVAVADGGGDRVMTSFNGSTWTPRTAAEANSWRSVTWIGGSVNQFVAVASDGANRVMTSPDGVTWTAHSAPAGAWTSVTTKTSTNDLLVAVADNDTNRVMTSPDGVTWTAQTAAENNAWTSVTWAGGTDNVFVAVASSGTSRVMTSPDGVTWTAHAAAAANSWSSVATDGADFVAVSRDGTDRVMTSPDGSAWTIRTDSDASSSTWTSVTSAGANSFVAVSSEGTNRVVKSTDDGATWATGNSGAPSNAWQTVVYNGTNKLVAVASDGSTLDRVMTSADATSWTGGPAAANSWESVTYGAGLFVAVASDGTLNRVMTSPDGISWTLRAAVATNEWTSVTFGNGEFVAVSRDGTNRVMTSPDGIIWSPQIAAAPNEWASVTFGEGMFVAVSGNGTDRVMTSPDGENWTPRTAPASGWQSVTWGGGTFVAVGSGNAVMSSPDGVAWTAQTAPGSGHNWTSVTYGGSTFVAVSTSQSDRVMTSPDGLTWTAGGDTTDTPTNPWLAVTYGASTFVATGTSLVMTATNPTDWTTHASAEDNAWLSVTFRNGMFVAVADEGTHRVMTSGTFTPPANPPTITSFDPTEGPVGTTVTITGTNFVDGGTTVRFDGVEATDVTVNSAARLTVVVPEGATTGKITVTTSGGTDVSDDDFTVTPSVSVVTRIWGPDAIDTSIAISEDAYPGADTATVVVLARSDFFADALAGGPLAADEDGPLLITPGAPAPGGGSIDPRVLDEIERVLPGGATVYVLGGPLAISAGVADDLDAAGFDVVRIGGANQFATAVDIAESIGSPSAILEATGWNFPDALSAVPAAIKRSGVILLTNDNVQAPETQAFIDAHPNLPRYTIGGSLVAGGADPDAANVSGPDLYATSAAVANVFFPSAAVFGVATGADFPDALSGGVFMATGGRMGPVLLVAPSTPLPSTIKAYLNDLDPGTPGYAFGGTVAISAAVLDAVTAAVGA